MTCTLGDYVLCEIRRADEHEQEGVYLRTWCLGWRRLPFSVTYTKHDEDVAKVCAECTIPSHARPYLKWSGDLV